MKRNLKDNHKNEKHVMQRKIKKTFYYMGLCSLLLLTACQSSNAQEEVVNEGIKVSIGEAQETQITDSYKAIGIVSPKDIVNVTPAVGGDVAALYIETGSIVMAGDVLYTIDDASAKSSYAQTASTLSASRDNVKLQLDRAVETRDKMLVLYQQGAIAVSELNSAEDQVASLQNQYDSARTTYSEQISTLASSIDDYTVVSPIDGIVSSVTFSEGERVTAQSQISIIDTTAVEVNAGLTAKQLKALNDVSDIYVILATDESRTRMPVVLDKVNTLKNTTTQLYDATFKFETFDGYLMDGIYAEIWFNSAARTAMTLPKSAIKYVGETTYVFYVEEGVAKRLNVTLGSIVADRVETLDLPADKLWITNGVDQIQDGVKVNVE